jgi:hypothetical protein
MDFQCYQILIVTTDGETIILEEDGIIELVLDFSSADSIEDLFELIKSLFFDLEELSDAQFEFFKRLAEIKDLSELIKIEITIWFYNNHPEDNSIFDEETGLYISTDKVNYNFIDKSYHYDTNQYLHKPITKGLDIDFKGKVVVVSGYPCEARTIGLINWLAAEGAIIHDYVSHETEYLIFNPDHLFYTSEFRHAHYRISKGENIKILSGTNYNGPVFTEYIMPPVFEFEDSAHTILKSYNGLETDVIVPDGVIKVDDYVFSGHFKIKSITFPDSVVEISDNAYFDMKKCLERVVLPPKLKGLTTHDCNPFWCCEKLESIVVSPESQNVVFEQNCLIEKGQIEDYLRGLNFDNKLVWGCKDSVIPDYVAYIGNRAFANIKDLKTLKLPSNLKYISECVFDGCSALEEMIIPNGVEFIGNFSYAYCNNLKAVYIPPSVKEIEPQAFWESNNLTLYIKNNPYAEQFAVGMDIPYITIS